MLYYSMPTFLKVTLFLFPMFLVIKILSSKPKKRLPEKHTEQGTTETVKEEVETEVETYTEQSNYKYTRKTYLVTKAENEFFKILLKILDNQYHVFPQIHLISLLEHRIVGQGWKGAKNHIDRLSVDYVICDRTYLSPILAIELDDITHERGDRIARDLRVERILEEAKIPLVRVRYKDRFNQEIIKKHLSQFLKKLSDKHQLPNKPLL